MRGRLRRQRRRLLVGGGGGGRGDGVLGRDQDLQDVSGVLPEGNYNLYVRAARCCHENRLPPAVPRGQGDVHGGGCLRRGYRNRGGMRDHRLCVRNRGLRGLHVDGGALRRRRGNADLKRRTQAHAR